MKAKLTLLSLLAMKVSAELPTLEDPNADGWIENTNSGVWGWNSQPPNKNKDDWPAWVKSGYTYPLLEKLQGDKIAECSDAVMEKAGEKFGDDAGNDKAGQFSQYPGGSCALITEWDNKDGEPECESGGAINFLHLYYCTMESFGSTGQDVVMFPLAFLFLGIGMYNLGSTADVYLSPALEAISDKLSCSESLAGVTLLALGNGAPDVFAAIAAGGEGEDGIAVQISLLMGSSLFIVTCVLALALRASATDQRIKVTKVFFVRDVAFLVATCVYLLLIVFVFEKIDLPISLGFIAIYLVFVAVVVVQSKMLAKQVPDDEDGDGVAEQTARAIDFSEMVQFKRQKLKRKISFGGNGQGRTESISNQAANVFKNLGTGGFGKKVDINILDEDDDLSIAYLKSDKKFLSKGFNQQKRLKSINAPEDGQDLLGAALNASTRQEAKSAYVRQAQPDTSHLYAQEDVIDVTEQTQRTLILKQDDEASQGLYEDNSQSMQRKQDGSVNIVVKNQMPLLDGEHVERQSKLIAREGSEDMDGSQNKIHDQVYAAVKLKAQLKRTLIITSIFGKCFQLVEVPLNILRDYSIPMADYEEWSRVRAAMVCLFTPISLAFLLELLAEGGETATITLLICAGALVPGIGGLLYICFCTKKTQAPPVLMFIFAVVGFVMAIIWIAWTSDVVIDILQIIGLIAGLPQALLGLTLLAVGNCLGDMNANVAMTKKGFGEMAVTGCLAGPVFNILMGLGLSCFLSLLKDEDLTEIPWSLTKDGKFDKGNVLPFGLISAMLVALAVIFANMVMNNGQALTYKIQQINLVIYACTILGLVIFVLTDDSAQSLD